MQQEIIDFRKKSYTTLCDLLTPNVPIIKPGKRALETEESILNDFQKKIDKILQKNSLKRKSESTVDYHKDKMKKSKLKVNESLNEIPRVVCSSTKSSDTDSIDVGSFLKKKYEHRESVAALITSISAHIQNFDLRNSGNAVEGAMSFSYNNRVGPIDRRVEKSIAKEKVDFNSELDEFLEKYVTSFKKNILKKFVLDRLSRKLFLLAVEECTLFREELKQIDLQNDDGSCLQSLFGPINGAHQQHNSEMVTIEFSKMDNIASNLYQSVCVDLQKHFEKIGGPVRPQRKYAGRKQLKGLSKYATKPWKKSEKIKKNFIINSKLEKDESGLQNSMENQVDNPIISRNSSGTDVKVLDDGQKDSSVNLETASASTVQPTVDCNSKIAENVVSSQIAVTEESEKEEGEIEENTKCDYDESTEFFTIFGETSEYDELKKKLQSQNKVFLDLNELDHTPSDINLNIYIYLAENNCLENIPNLCKLRCSNRVRFLLFETISDVLSDSCVEIMPNGGIVVLDRGSTSFCPKQCQAMFNFFIQEKRRGTHWHAKLSQQTLENSKNEEIHIFDNYKKKGILSYEDGADKSLIEFLINFQNENMFYNWYRRLILLSDKKTSVERSDLEKIGVECMEMNIFMNEIVNKS